MTQNKSCEGCSDYDPEMSFGCVEKNIDGSCPCCVCIVKMMTQYCSCEPYREWRHPPRTIQKHF